MIEQIYNYFTIEILYYWVNIGVLPFWLILVFFPRSHISRYFVTSIFPFLLLSGAYVFMLYKSYLNSFDFVGNFNLYMSISDLSELFSNKSFLMMFPKSGAYMKSRFASPVPIKFIWRELFFILFNTDPIT